MKGKICFINLWVIMALLPGCNETLEDTYKDYAGDGKIRYVAKCTEISVEPGWECLRMEWKNGTDAMVENIKVSWSISDVKRDSLLDKSVTSCEIKNLKEDGTYRIDICAVSKDGSESLVETAYGRPYTESHEGLRSFTRGITKFYKVKNHLAFFMDRWNEEIIEINLHYTDIQGDEVIYPLTKDVFNKKFVVLPDVNTDKPIYITRLGKLEGCPDLIRFTPYTLSDERILSSDFKTTLQQRYGFSDKTEEAKKDLEHFMDTVRVLEFDYNMTTFEDILYCPKIEKLVLGKNRYLHSFYRVSTDVSILYDKEKSFQVLDEANRLLGLKVERYNQHYFTEVRPYIQNMGNPSVPANLTWLPEYLDDIENSVPETADYDSGLRNLLDNIQSSWWEPVGSPSSVRSHELIITLKSPQFVRGIKIAQAIFDPQMDKKSIYYLPGQARVMVSQDKVNWKNAGYVSEYPIGQGAGEITLIPMAVPSEIRYIKVIVNDRFYANMYSTKLADIVPYR